MKTKLFLLFVSVILFVSVRTALPQFVCSFDSISSIPHPTNIGGGLFKPHRTDISDGSPASSLADFHILIIFASFPDDIIPSDEWPINQPPRFKDSLLAASKISTGNYWDRYNASSEILSDYYQEVSQGKFHVTGITRYYKFKHDRSFYSELTMNDELYDTLQKDLSIDWTKFDKWKYLSEGNYKFEPDSNVDMIMMVRRFDDYEDGIPQLLGNNKEIDTVNHIWIRTGWDSLSSGLTVNGTPESGGPIGLQKTLGICIHEFGHYLFGDHASTGIMTSRGGLAINDLFYSPFEKIRLGYLDPQVVSFPSLDTYLGDYSSRSSNEEVLKVPVSESEYFLITNRRKISAYDRIMLGDTTALDIYKNTGDYDKGVYIYHGHIDSNYYPISQDLECADGLWKWNSGGTAIPDFQTTPITVWKRNGIISPLLNDNGLWFTGNDSVKDGISSSGYAGDGIWFSKGKKNASINHLGSD